MIISVQTASCTETTKPCAAEDNDQLSTESQINGAEKVASVKCKLTKFNSTEKPTTGIDIIKGATARIANVKTDHDNNEENDYTSGKYFGKDDYELGEMQNDYIPSKNTAFGKRPTKMDKRIKANKKILIEEDDDMNKYSGEYRVKRKLLRYYDKMTRPVRNDTTKTTVVVGMSLFHILDTVR